MNVLSAVEWRSNRSHIIVVSRHHRQHTHIERRADG